MASLSPAIKPFVQLLYNGRDITTDLSPYLMSMTFTDKLSGESDALDLTLGDVSSTATRWLGDWYPDKQMTMLANYGYAGQALATTGEMEVDEIAIAAPPMEITIRALSAGLKRQARTRVGKSYEGKTLSQIVDAVAQNMGAKRSGEIKPDPTLDRVTQYQEGNWAFLYRLMQEYGYTIKLANNNKTIVVARPKTMAEQQPVRTLYPGDLTSWRYRDKITDVPAITSNIHHDPHTGKTVRGQSKSKGEHAADEHNMALRAKTPEQAQAQAEGQQERDDADKTGMEATLMGDPRLAAGSLVVLAGFQAIDGTYLIGEARHAISRSGYVLDVQLKRLPEDGA
jgi:phage protein D